MNLIIIFTLFWVFTFNSTQALARWVKFEEAQRTNTIDSEDVFVNLDGTFIRESRRAFKLNSESARQNLDVLEVYYNAAIETAEVVEAFVTTDQQRLPVPKKLISDQADLGDDKGLDKTRVIKIALPNVKVGSVIDYRVRRRTTQPLLHGVYNEVFHMGYAATLKGATARIKSQLPLQFKVYGPEGHIGVKTEKSNKTFVYEFTLLKDSHFRTTNESEYPNWSEEPTYPLIQVTSLKDWLDLSEKINPTLETLLKAPLPLRYSQLVDRAKKETTFSRRMDLLTSGLSTELRYLGDWRASPNHYFPRTLAETSDRGFGDCKDFALLLVKMARVLGYRANLALVHRGELTFEPMLLPMPRHFNHMMTQIEDESGKIFWIDPTNSLHDSTHVNRDIAGRPALILSKDSKQLSIIPAEQPEQNIFRMEAELDYLETDRLILDVNIHTAGEDARDIIHRMSNKNDTQRREYVMRIFSAKRPFIKGDYRIDELPKNLLRPFNMSSRVELQDNPIQTAEAFVISVSRDYDQQLNFSFNDMILGIKIGEIGANILKQKYKNSIPIGSLPENCSVDSKWITAERKYSTDGDSITIESVIRTKQSYVSNQELKSRDFETFRMQLRRCLSERLIMYRKKGA